MLVLSACLVVRDLENVCYIKSSIIYWGSFTFMVGEKNIYLWRFVLRLESHLGVDFKWAFNEGRMEFRKSNLLRWTGSATLDSGIAGSWEHPRNVKLGINNICTPEFLQHTKRASSPWYWKRQIFLETERWYFLVSLQIKCACLYNWLKKHKEKKNRNSKKNVNEKNHVV